MHLWPCCILTTYLCIAACTPVYACRFRYNSVRLAQTDSRRLLNENTGQAGGSSGVKVNAGMEYADTDEDDAFSTIVQWLHSRIPDIVGKS